MVQQGFQGVQTTVNISDGEFPFQDFFIINYYFISRSNS